MTAKRKGMAKKRPLMKSPPTDTVYATYNSVETALNLIGVDPRSARPASTPTVPSVIGSWAKLLSR
jgi:hypothetical protein